mgnify:CR=1 FL=1|tara:strand:+ start:620 stop:889 length:270 start_codon:yes stop_codon:yes gene_type:complete
MKLSKEQQEELEKLQKEIIEEAKLVVNDYVINQSEESGSVVQIHENSPYLDEQFTGESWKKVIKVNDASQVMEDVAKHNKKVKEKKKKE